MSIKKVCFGVVVAMVLIVSTFPPTAFGDRKTNIDAKCDTKTDAKCDAKNEDQAKNGNEKGLMMNIDDKCDAKTDAKCDAKNEDHAKSGNGAPISTTNNEKSLMLSRKGMMSKLDQSNGGGVNTITGCRGTPCNFLVAPCQLSCVCVPISFSPFGICSGICC